MTRDSSSFVDQIYDFEHTSARLERGLIFPLITLIPNVLEYIVFFLSYGTLAGFVKATDCCFGTLPVTVKFVVLSTVTC